MLWVLAYALMFLKYCSTPEKYSTVFPCFLKFSFLQLISFSMSKKYTTVAIAYDFDGTLAKGNIQENSFIPELGMDKETFIQQFFHVS
jgi:hypothetical protein